MVTIAGSPSGMAETASETEVIKMSSGGMSFRSPMTKIIAQAISATTPRYLPSFASFCWSGVASSVSLFNSPAILPISVFIPVAVMMAVAEP